MSEPGGLAFDSSGVLYVANKSGSISEVYRNGVDAVVVSPLISTGLSGPDIFGTVTGSYNLIGSNVVLSGIANGTNGNIVGQAALLSSNGVPLTGSPAIQAGGPSLPWPKRGTGDQTIYVNNAATIASTPGQFYIEIDGEEMLVSNINLAANTITVTRQVNNFSFAPQAGDPVYLLGANGSLRATPPDMGAVQVTPISGPTLGSLAPAHIPVGHSYSASIAIFDYDFGTGPFTISNYSGPGSLVASVSGNNITISGTAPNTPQTITFSVGIKDSNGATASKSYTLVVDPYTVTNTSTDSSVVGSLPYEVAEADSDTSGTAITITFAAGTGQPFATPQTIALAGTLGLDNTDESITINGPAAGLTLQGSNNVSNFFGVFTVAANTTASIANLTISNGADYVGGGIYNAGILTVSNATLSGNMASGYGGGIFNYSVR